MSWRAVEWSRGRGGTVTQQCVLFALADRANDHGIAWPSQKDLAEGCCAVERTVRGSLRELERLGLIARVSRYSKRGHRLTDMIVLAPRTADRGQMFDVEDEEIDRGRYTQEVGDLAREPEELPAGNAGTDPIPARNAGRRELLAARSAGSTGSKPPDLPASDRLDLPARHAGEQLKEQPLEPEVNKDQEAPPPESLSSAEVESVELTGRWRAKLDRIEAEHAAAANGIDIEKAAEMSLAELRAAVPSEAVT